MSNLIVTGASGGLGTAVTAYLLDHGHSVLAVGSRAASLEELPSHPNLQTHVADITTAHGAQSVVDAAQTELGSVDGLAHLVGGFAMGELEGLESEANWERMFKLNVESAFHCFRAVLPSLRQSRGAIVAVSSLSVRTPGASLSAYVASKAALEALVKSVAAEVKSDGVRVNAVAPGTINTPANRAAMGENNAAAWVQPENLAATIAFLLSESAGDITGAVVEVSGSF